MQIKTTVNQLLLEEEISKERRSNLAKLNQLRILTISLFFILHLVMGYVFDVVNFRGKELHFLAYLTLALVIFALNNRKEQNIARSEYSLPLFDIPLTYFILQAWLPTLTHTSSTYLLSVLGLAFMMFFVTLSGLFFSLAITLPTTLAGLAIVHRLFSETNISINTHISSSLLLCLTGYTTFSISSQVKKLIASATHKQSMNEKLSRYFAPEVANFIQRQASSENDERVFDVTVLFTDIRDFTKMASSMSGTEVIRMLNEVHEHLVSCIFLTGGTLDKYLGDGVMAYFGAPVESKDHADKAVECALMMRDEIRKLNEKRLARGDNPIALGIGIHSGPVVIGDIGAEIRREFTIIGDTVNTSSRIESLTKKHQVDLLLTAETKSRLTRTYELKSLGTDEIRGSNRSIETFTL